MLIQFFHATGGPTSWAIKWNVSSPTSRICGGWHGVICVSRNTQVDAIKLDINGLTGPMDRALQIVAGLPNLTWLQLYRNFLTGPIPSLAQLTRLRYLDIGENLLTGTIPELRGFSQLQNLSLQVNQFVCPLPSFAGLKNLLLVKLEINKFNGTIPTFPDSLSLEYLTLANNPFTNLASLSHLRNLKLLHIQNCDFRGQPSIVAFANLTKLTSLQLTQGRSALPFKAGEQVLRQFTELRRVKLSASFQLPDFRDNPLLQDVTIRACPGPIPSFAWLSQLENLTIDDSHRLGDISPLFALKTLRSLHISHSNISGTLPAISHTGLISLILEDDQFTGRLPSLAGLPQLEEFSVRNNKFSGALPEFPHPKKKGENSHIIKLDLSQNAFVGTIPSLYAMINLQELNLSSNSLVGPLPQLTRVYYRRFRVFDVSNNPGLNATVNSDMFGMDCALQSYSIANTSVSGALPSIGNHNLSVCVHLLSRYACCDAYYHGFSQYFAADHTWVQAVDPYNPIFTGMASASRFSCFVPFVYDAFCGDLRQKTGQLRAVRTTLAKTTLALALCSWSLLSFRPRIISTSGANATTTSLVSTVGLHNARTAPLRALVDKTSCRTAIRAMASCYRA